MSSIYIDALYIANFELADKYRRARYVDDRSAAAVAYGLLAFGKGTPCALGTLAPMVLLGISFAVLVASSTASVMSSVKDQDEDSGINNAVSRIAYLAGIALAAGLAERA